MISFEEGLEMMYGKQKKDAPPMINSLSLSDRPDWDSWFMTLCFVIAQRSLDKDTKHGCVAVGESRTILSVGYNSPPRGCMDEYVPLERPDKYDYMEHSEENAIVNAALTGACLKNSTFYITGPPCHRCFAKMLNVGARKIIHGPTPSVMVNSHAEKVIKFMKMNQKIEVVELKNINPVYALLSKTEAYIDAKMGGRNEAEKSSANS